jgi:hypothetical protein
VNAVKFLPVVLFGCALAATQCRSLDGLTGGASDKDAGAADADVDSGVQPACTPNPDTGTACVTVRVDETSAAPGYGAFSGAGSVKVDGTGFIQVLLFDKDPTEPTNGHVLPKVTLRHPPAAGSTLTLDTLPAELVGNAAPGSYWVYAYFADNDVDSRGTGLLGQLPGDFVTQLAIGQPDLIPKITLAAGEAQTLEIPLVPLRELMLDCSITPTLASAVQSNATIHGDGPASFFLYDGNLTAGAPDVVDFGQVNCMDMKLSSPTPPSVTTVSFGVTTTGTHNVFGSLYDYQSPDPSSINQTPGTLESNAGAPPQAVIDPTSWTATVEVPFNSVVAGISTGANDPLHCN